MALGLLSCSTVLLAQESDFGAPSSSTMASTPTSAGEDDHYSLRANFGPSLESYKLAADSGGFTTSQKLTRGFEWGFEGRYHPLSTPFSFRLGIQHFETRFENVSGSNQRQILTQRNLYQGLVLIQPVTFGSKILEPLRAGVGYFIYRRNADDSIPSVVNDTSQSGLQLALAYAGVLSKDFSYDATLAVELPGKFEETSTQRTGFFTSAYNAQLQAMVAYPISDLVDIAAGLIYRRERTYFAGRGTRGATVASSTADGTEMDTTWALPFQLRLKF